MLAKKQKNKKQKQKLNFFCSALFHMKTRVSHRYFVNDCRIPIQTKALINLKSNQNSHKF